MDWTNFLLIIRVLDRRCITHESSGNIIFCRFPSIIWVSHFLHSEMDKYYTPGIYFKDSLNTKWNLVPQYSAPMSSSVVGSLSLLVYMYMGRTVCVHHTWQDCHDFSVPSSAVISLCWTKCMSLLTNSCLYATEWLPYGDMECHMTVQDFWCKKSCLFFFPFLMEDYPRVLLPGFRHNPTQS